MLPGRTQLLALNIANNRLSELIRNFTQALPRGLTSLTLSGNELTTPEITPEAIRGFPATLTRFDVSDCLISNVSDGAFESLPHLTELDLSLNFLTDISAAAFNGLSALQTLAMTDGELRSISLPFLSSLTTLNLARNLR